MLRNSPTGIALSLSRRIGSLVRSSRSGSRVGAGISAFPSLHVAGAAWVAAVVASLSRKLAPLAWAYFLLILMGSVYLGWHYALDGIAGLIIALVMFRLVSWSPRREAKLRPATELGE